MRLGIEWQIGVPSGWGTYGFNLLVQMVRLGHSPVPLVIDPSLRVDPLTDRLLERAMLDHARAKRIIDLHGEAHLPYPVLFGIGDQLTFFRCPDSVSGSPSLGVVFLESATIPPDNVEAARSLPLILTGSSWNQQILEAHGLTNARFCPQGIDPSLFHPAPRAGLVPPDRFVVFSGGKLEYRKGQDIVVGAFRRFYERHPDALLMTAWHNLWPASLETLGYSPHVDGRPGYDETGRLKVGEWLRANGLPREAFIDLGALTNAQVPRLLRDADLAVFPNRAEGGTNLVAMEAMACGIPTILSANTGHLDLIAGAEDVGEPVCWALANQIPIGQIAEMPALEGWGETTDDDLLEAMEAAYADRDESRRRGAAAARFMAGWSWEAQTRKMVSLIEEVL